MQAIRLARFLTVDVPEDLDVTFQIFPHYSEEENVLCGWDGDKLIYAVATDEQPGGYSNAEYWGGMLDAFKADENVGVSVVKEGIYECMLGAGVEYKIFKMQAGEEVTHQIMCLISDQRVAYWVFTTLIDHSDIFLVNRFMGKILSSARIEVTATITS